MISARGVDVHRTAHSNAISLRIGTGRREHRSSSDFANALRDIGIYKDKHIPDLYTRASIYQRTDDHYNTRGTATFVNKNADLSR